MYTNHFGLTDQPFRLTPDLEYMFMSSGHARAKAYVDYSMVSKDGFVVITGDIGAGKTMLMRKLLSELQGDVILVHIDQTQLSPVEFLQAIVTDLIGEAGTDNKVELMRRLRQCLEQAASKDLRVVICVDEAQALTYEVLEELRFLTAMESHSEKLISVVLMGQPELQELLESPQLEQLRQRVRLHLHLGGMTQDECYSYVVHRLEVAGSAHPEDVFSDDSWEVIETYTGGVPRLINILCDMALLKAYVEGKRQVDEDLVAEAAAELKWQPYSERQSLARAWRSEGAPRSGSNGKSMAPVAMDGQLGNLLGRIDETLQGINLALNSIADSLSQPQPGDKPDKTRPDSAKAGFLRRRSS